MSSQAVSFNFYTFYDTLKVLPNMFSLNWQDMPLVSQIPFKESTHRITEYVNLPKGGDEFCVIFSDLNYAVRNYIKIINSLKILQILVLCYSNTTCQKIWTVDGVGQRKYI
jgi:hypothetical protein